MGITTMSPRMESIRVPSTSAICGALLLWAHRHTTVKRALRLLKIGRKTLTAHRAFPRHYHPTGPDNVLPRFQSPTAHHPSISPPLTPIFHNAGANRELNFR